MMRKSCKEMMYRDRKFKFWRRAKRNGEIRRNRKLQKRMIHHVEKQEEWWKNDKVKIKQGERELKR